MARRRLQNAGGRIFSEFEDDDADTPAQTTQATSEYELTIGIDADADGTIDGGKLQVTESVARLEKDANYIEVDATGINSNPPLATSSDLTGVITLLGNDNTSLGTTSAVWITNATYIITTAQSSKLSHIFVKSCSRTDMNGSGNYINVHAQLRVTDGNANVLYYTLSTFSNGDISSIVDISNDWYRFDASYAFHFIQDGDSSGGVTLDWTAGNLTIEVRMKVVRIGNHSGVYENSQCHGVLL